MIVPIEDPGDPRLAEYRDIRDADARGRAGLFVGEQTLVVARMLALPGVTKSVLVTPRQVEGMAAWADGAVPVYVAPLGVLQAVAGFPIHRGVLALGYRQPFDGRVLSDLLPGKGQPGCLLACEGITNVDNIGLLFRNAAAFAVSGVLLDPSSHDPLYRKALRVSIGHALTVPWRRSSDWSGDLDRLREAYGFRLIGASPAAGATDLDDLPVPDRSVLLVGTESDGLRPETLARCDHVARIPMAPGTDSLNVAVAAAVCLHRWSRVGRV
jgi:tRNA G18 (ribose-2'-O)-methylase SpoU